MYLCAVCTVEKESLDLGGMESLVLVAELAKLYTPRKVLG